jgi:hypothetical protein
MNFNIDEYTEQDILDLFSIKLNDGVLSKDDVKRAYRKCCCLHPDKSKLSNDYFIFYSRALEKLKQMYRMYNNTEYMKDRSLGQYRKENKELKQQESAYQGVAEELTKRDDFSKVFNQAFDNARMGDPENDAGYSDWLKDTSTETQNIAVSNISDMHKAIAEKKRTLARTQGNELMMLNTATSAATGGSSLMREQPVEYSSGLFSSLKYEDLRKAHTETLIPIDDTAPRQEYASVDEYERVRQEGMVADARTLKAQQEAELRRQEELQQKRYIAQQTYLMEQERIAKEKQSGWWSSLLQLTAR